MPTTTSGLDEAPGVTDALIASGVKNLFLWVLRKFYYPGGPDVTIPETGAEIPEFSERESSGPSPPSGEIVTAGKRSESKDVSDETECPVVSGTGTIDATEDHLAADPTPTTSSIATHTRTVPVGDDLSASIRELFDHFGPTVASAATVTTSDFSGNKSFGASQPSGEVATTTDGGRPAEQAEALRTVRDEPGHHVSSRTLANDATESAAPDTPDSAQLTASVREFFGHCGPDVVGTARRDDHRLVRDDLSASELFDRFRPAAADGVTKIARRRCENRPIVDRRDTTRTTPRSARIEPSGVAQPRGDTASRPVTGLTAAYAQNVAEAERLSPAVREFVDYFRPSDGYPRPREMDRW